MKKIICLFLALAMLLTFAACGGSNTTTESTPADSAQTSSENKNQDSGNTELTVDAVKNAKETDASLFEYEDVDGGVSITGFNGEDEIVVIPETIEAKNVVAIGRAAFANNANIRAVKISDNVQQLKNDAFQNCTALEIAILGSNVKKIFGYAFNGCHKLSYIELNDGLETLDELCFGSCLSLEEIEIPESVTTIYYSFTPKEGESRKIIGTPGSAAEDYVKEYGAEDNVVFQAK